MTTLLNLNWNPDSEELFLGDALGVADYVRVAHPELERLALLQRSQFWTETEISLESDKKQWPNLPREIQEITLLNLAWQVQTDSFISRAPEAAIMPLVSRPELEGMLKQWSYFEDLHSRAYSNIIRNVLTDPAEFIDSVTKNQEAFARIADSVELFDELYLLGQYFLAVRDHRGDNTYPETEFPEVKRETQAKLLDAYFAIYGLEAMQFYASFACTFALAENDILQGIAKNLQLIAKDEALHTQMSKAIIQIMFQQFDKDLVDEALAKAPAQLLKTLKTEIEWGHFIFKGRSLIGLNAELLEEYLYFVGRNAFMHIGVEWPSHLPVITKNPIPWIMNWLDTTSLQPAPQEIQIGAAYRVGQVTETSADTLKDLGNEFEDMF
ncbi:ribonucleotide-diphosphate reductase class Ia (aerobic) beta subunit [Salmonella phage gmork]|uniref:ribonucleoside-diphosphate reductase n=4 Tax=Epseptimavirus TaxID=2732017 RepID=A0A6G8RGJ6_9CAUD|nr:putative aerobic ribonucleoside diphosphate reductase small subunit [Salmonella phage 1-23]YP_009858294.1 ribonucleotide-diphosphate reductase class Ia (aerobic) beta subunit [Salmonella phage rokbiter]EDA1230721.1 ribonucleoside-diphosphate reductase [Salmonella enterica subsp. enterica serovar Derby]EHV4370632.1 ribonucleotide-diphosphate reductase subunit beta [Salmonella enterica]QIN99858.1 ribonucleotide-diphosphate reductase class Ia (aerobic) beta subunit [Salmonella phage misterkot]